MPVIVSPTRRAIRLLGFCTPFVLLSIAALLRTPQALEHDGCMVVGAEVSVCAASSMSRISRSGPSILEHPRFDLSSDNPDRLHWRVAKNETIAFQLEMRRKNRHAAKEVAVRVNGGDGETLITVSKAHYLKVKNAGYQWGPATAVLPYPASYPDALIPEWHGCGSNRKQLFSSIRLPPPGAVQSIWIEMYVPPDAPVGKQLQLVSLELNDEVIELPVVLDVVDVRLPHKTSIDAVAELYRTYHLEGSGSDRQEDGWQQMAQCYQQMAHQHRMVFIERTPVAPVTSEDWLAYEAAFGPGLSGDLFTEQFGYVGTGYNTPVSVWRTPWPQDYDIAMQRSLNKQEIDRWTLLAKSWSKQVQANDWTEPRYFAYVFDEVDGPSGVAETDPQRHRYIKRVHDDMRNVQTAIDRGASDIDLLWTSHSDPSIWQKDPKTTLEGIIRLWAPNAHAANTDFLAKRIAKGERAWFYHSGHPAVGGHSINLPGTDMRSWGVIGARYGFQGQLMWAANLGSDRWPYSQPSYKPDDDRIGNGVLVYPGNQLPKIGFDAVPGPIPSMRMKAWRRGLQDAELYLLAREKNPHAAQSLISTLIPRALGEALAAGDQHPSWPAQAGPWIQWREQLLSLLAQS